MNKNFIPLIIDAIAKGTALDIDYNGEKITVVPGSLIASTAGTLLYAYPRNIDVKKVVSLTEHVEKTYKVGDRFVILGVEVMLVQTAPGTVGLLHLNLGRLWNHKTVSVSDVKRVAESAVNSLSMCSVTPIL